MASFRPSHTPGIVSVGSSMNNMSRQALGNALASVLFLVVAIVDYVRESSGIGVVFLVFAGVFLVLAFSGRSRPS
jgi:hypothetical protein